MSGDTALQEKRRDAMKVLSHVAAADIENRMAALPVPPHQDLRAPESGLVMVRGRIGGDGAPFNLGEATVSRAAVRLQGGQVGFGYVLGRDGGKARLIALCDALLQSSDHAKAIEREVVAPLRAQMQQERDRSAAEAAATRVDFYTMVRGEG
ncbi:MULTISPECIES: phosphonate C-P lyase system protein PhnG [unclassified Bradyrhizobium]|uniref:phosphonate C-P lyase system protein PhnG n=1 Tax=unclassified Bradyrhizobium TaxID=2631580 RepID=UPI0028ED1D07|nr:MULTISPECIES: phosphonate C-P lyase system protein PhnG [unclassified Bradyrhizobium]